MSEARKRPLQSVETRPAYPRKRAAQACLTCRRRRTKCDNEQPTCTSCSRLGVECVYREIDKSSFDPASLAILQRLDDLEILVKASPPQHSPLPTARYDASPLLDHGSAQSAGLELDSSMEARRMNIEAVLSWPILGMEVRQAHRPLLSLLRPCGSNATLHPLLAADLTAKDAANLLQLFLNHFHIYNPVLDVYKIEEHMRHTVLNGIEWDARSCLLLLVYALGTIMSEGDQPHFETSAAFHQTERFHRAEAFFLAARKRMGLLLFGGGVTEAQVFFLAGVYLMTTMRPVEAWKIFVQALTCCQAFPPILDDSNSEEARVQHSIYWTCFRSELEVRMELGITETSVWNLRYPASFPEPPRSLHSEGEPAWYFYLAEIALRRLENRVFTSTCWATSGAKDLSEKVSTAFEFELQVNDWAASLPESLQLKKDQNGSLPLNDSNQHFRFILNGHMLDCLEMIYWPFIERVIHGHLSNDQSSFVFAHRGLDLCVRRIEENEWGFRHRHHGTWLMLRSCTRSAFVLVAAARAGLADKLPQSWEEAISKVVQLLEYWKDEAPDAADRLKVLKSLASYSFTS